MCDRHAEEEARHGKGQHHELEFGDGSARLKLGVDQREDQAELDASSTENCAIDTVSGCHPDHRQEEDVKQLVGIGPLEAENYQ